MEIVQEIQNKLFSLQDRKYKKFHSALMPNIDPNTVIGVRVPLLKQLAKTLMVNSQVEEFLNHLPHSYYEENNLHAFILCEEKNFEVCLHKLNKFLPYVDNWATCDSMRPKCFKKHKDLLFKEIKVWLTSKYGFVVRFGLEMLMVHFLDHTFSSDAINLAITVKSQQYYVNMMLAWFFATALVKQWDKTIKILEDKILDVFVHNKTIQKACESYRITVKQKEFLKSLKI